MADHIYAAAQLSRPSQSGDPTNAGKNAHVGTNKGDVPPLLGLPCELLVHTASYLSHEDLFSLRLTCHSAETLLFETFSGELFSDRRFMVTEYSLKCLLNISKHPHLSKRLSKLTIGLDRLCSSDAVANSARRDGDPDRPHARRGIIPENLEALSVEQNWLISSGRLQLLLKEVLENLPNIVEFSLRDTNATRKSGRPGAMPLRVSYGVAEVRRQTGVDFIIDEPHIHSQDQFPDIVFSASMLAIARSGKKLRSITAAIQKPDIGLSSSAFAMPQHFLESLKPCLQSIRSLDLSISFTYVSLGSFSKGSLAFLRWQPHYLFPLLANTPNLTSLRVRSKGYSFMKDGVIGWLARLATSSDEGKADVIRLDRPVHTTLASIPPVQRFEALRELQLGDMVAPATSLTAVLLFLSGSLRQLHLYTVGVSVLRGEHELDTDSASPNAWDSIFREIAKSLCLEELKVASLGHHTQSCSLNGNRHQVAFLKSDKGEQSGPHHGPLSTWSYVGSRDSMKAFLLEIATNTVIICSTCKQRNSGYKSFEDTLELQA